jgi:hypothetical protein
MKKIASVLSAAACMAALTAASIPASAEESSKVYGTMNIPYADFYSAEIESAYEVDAVSSATKARDENSKAKWQMNQEGGLVAGTYNDGNGSILGVTFPVEVDAADVEALAKYDFKALDEKPAAYKEVTVSGDTLTVSKLIDTNGEQKVSGSAEVSTSTRYGDYQLNVKGYPEETDLYGVIVNTKEGDKYALRHLENIWRAGQISWSAGINTTEVHGNELKYENYTDSMGKTVTSVTFITLDGYTTVDVGENYLPVKFAGEVKAEDSAAGTGKTSLTLTGFPDDYKKNITIGDSFTVSGSTISYTGAKPGKYTVNVTDENGKYAPMSGDFTLTTDDMPVKYEDGKLVKADGSSDDDAENFIRNIASVDVNGTAYNAAGKRSVKIVGEDGTIDFAVTSNETPVFDGSGNYSITVTATGYTSPYSFEIKPEPETTATITTTATTPSGNSTLTDNSDSPKTGDAGAGIPAAIFALAAMTAFALRKNKK